MAENESDDGTSFFGKHVNLQVLYTTLGSKPVQVQFDRQAHVEDVKQRLQTHLGKFVTFTSVYLIDLASGCKYKLRDDDYLSYYFPRDGWTLEAHTVETDEEQTVKGAAESPTETRASLEANGEHPAPAACATESSLLTDPARDAERLATFELAMKVAQLQAQGFIELQTMLKQEQAARVELEAKLETVHQMMEARMIDVVGSVQRQHNK
eukprot:7895472-Pyramimonas_sp.AAC.1